MARKKTTQRKVRAARRLAKADQDRLVVTAMDVRGRAYAPYSGYHVGAAVLTASGRVFGGCNVENASYGLSLCAERGALSAAVAAGHSSFEAIAIVADSIASPCGACRQFMVEFNPEMAVILADAHGNRKLTRARDLLPDFFGPDDLKA